MKNSKLKETIKTITIFLLVLGVMYLLLVKTLVITNKNDIRGLISLVSNNLVSSIVGAAIGGLIAYLIATIGNNRQEKFETRQFETQQKNSDIQFNRQLKLSENHFKSQQLMELKKIEVDFYIENIITVQELLNELLDLLNRELTPLTKQMISLQNELKQDQHNLLFESSFEVSLVEIDSYHNSYLKLISRFHDIINRLETLSTLFDSYFSGNLTTLIKGVSHRDKSGLIAFEGYMSDLWKANNEQCYTRIYIKYTFDSSDYIVLEMHINEAILNLTQKLILLEKKKKVSELKFYFNEQKN